MNITFRQYKEQLYQISIVLMLIYEIIFKQSNIKAIVNVQLVDSINRILWIMIICIQIFCIVFCSRYTWKCMIGSFTIVVVSMIACFISRDAAMIKFALFFIAAKDIRFRRVACTYIVTSTILCIGVIMGYIVGIIPNYLNSERFGVKRNALGFTAPSSLGFIGFNIVFYLFQFKKKSKMNFLFRIMVTIEIVLVLWYIANCRTGVVAIIFFITLYVLQKKSKKIFRYKVIALIPLICAIASVYITIFYDNTNNIHREINSLLALRPQLANLYYEIVGIHLFGTNAHLKLLDGIWLDNGYISVLLRYGVVNFTIILNIYYIALRKAIATRNDTIVMGVVTASLIGVSEMFIYSFSTNIILLWIATEIFQFKRIGSELKI